MLLKQLSNPCFQLTNPCLTKLETLTEQPVSHSVAWKVCEPCSDCGCTFDRVVPVDWIGPRRLNLRSWNFGLEAMTARCPKETRKFAEHQQHLRWSEWFPNNPEATGSSWLSDSTVASLESGRTLPAFLIMVQNHRSAMWSNFPRRTASSTPSRAGFPQNICARLALNYFTCSIKSQTTSITLLHMC